MKIETYQLALAPDRHIPRFKRLQFKQVEVPLADVFQRGIHPHSAVLSNKGRDHTNIEDAVLDKLNSEEAYVPGLKAHNLGHEISVHHVYCDRQDDVKQMLEQVSGQVYFVVELAYEKLVEIATERLRKIWNHEIAKNMVNAVRRDFVGMRDFLKQKKPDIKLVGYDSLNEYDLSRIVAVDDFLTEDSLLIQHGIESDNFRRADSIAGLTDSQGALKLIPAIKRCVVEWDTHPGNWAPLLTYHCAVEGSQVQWQPEIKEKSEQRAKAKQIAEAIGRGTGKYCFESTLEGMEKALEDEHFNLRFPDLDYKEKSGASEADAQVKPGAIVCYGETNGLRADNSNEQLKEVLRCFGKKLTGRKDELVKRVAELLAEEYQEHEKEMNRYFSCHRFVRLKAQPNDIKSFPVLKEHKLREPLLIMYCLRHMRGNVILEASHENKSVKLADLAEAFLCDRVELNGSFVPVS